MHIGLRVAGRLCEVDVDDCAGEPCEHDGTCDDHQNGFTCRCLPGFAGKLCSEIIEPDDNVTGDNVTISASVLYEPLEYQPSGQVGYAACYAHSVNISKLYMGRVRYGRGRSRCYPCVVSRLRSGVIN